LCLEIAYFSYTNRYGNARGCEKLQRFGHEECLKDMGQLKAKFILIILILMLSCADNDNLVKRRIPIDIYEITIPPSGTINQDVQVQLKAQATNGCFSELGIKLIEINSRHFLFKATGLFQSNGICHNMMVYKDTIINFKPSMTGKYFFQTNEDPFEIRKDTIDIN